MDRNIQTLETYLPAEAAPIIARWINRFQVELKISRTRHTKLGDYRPPYAGKPHRISVNYNLNPFSFLITLIHEFAHLTCWNKHQFRVKPHGEEWKQEFRELMMPWLDKSFFPPDVQQGLFQYMNNPAASSCTDLGLMRILEQYDFAHLNQFSLESLPAGTVFQIRDGRVFTKGAQLRKRYRCVENKTQRIYLFNPLAKVSLTKRSSN